MEPAIFFAGPPNLKELCCLSVLVSTSDNLCVMQPHIVRCREIIFTEPDVLASPTLDMDATFHIVLQQSLYKTGRLQMRLQKYGMQISKPYSVHHNLYQSCLTYTTIARISPQWNKAADWMIQGRDFVNHDGYTNAIKMSICVNREEIYISLSGTVVRFPPLQVEDLNLSRSEMLALLKSTEGVPRPVELDDAWCHVLPSMKRGKIASLALSIPKESPFASYKELKRHWKNMYGYRLPDTDEDILYCQIGFLPSGGGKHFTYPSVCLRGGPLHAVPRVDPKPVLTAFLQVIHSRVATVCGMALRFQPKLRYATPALHTSSMPPVRENLSTKQISRPNGPTRDEKSIASLFARKNTKKDPLIERLQDVAQPQPCNGSDGTDPVLSNPPLADVASIQEGYGFQQHQPYQKTTMENSLHSTHASLADTSCHSEESKHVWNEEITQTSKENIAMQINDSQTTPSKWKPKPHFDNSITVSSKKYVPSFWPKMKSHKSQASSIVLNRNHQDLPQSGYGTLVPKLKAHKTQKQPSNSSSADSLRKIGFTKISQSENMISGCSETESNIVPNKNNYISAGSNKCATDQHVQLFSVSEDGDDNSLYDLNEIQSTANATVMMKGALITKASRPQNKTSNVLMSQHKSHHMNTKTASPASRIQKSEISLCESPGNMLSSSFTTYRKEQKTSGVALEKSRQRPALANWCGESMAEDDFDCLLGTPTTGGNKRKKANQADTPVKKLTPKPQVQNVDVEALSRANQLSKVNTVTITAWLKEKKVACKSKDRKSDLVNKVNAFLNLPKTQF